MYILHIMQHSAKIHVLKHFYPGINIMMISALGLFAFHLETKHPELEPQSCLPPILPLTTEVIRSWMSNCNLGI